MTSSIDIENLKAVCEKIVREGDLDTLTDRVVRRFAETELSLEEKVLDEKPYKAIIKETVAAVVEKLTQENEANDSDGDSEEQQNKGADSDDNESDEENMDSDSMDVSDSKTKASIKRKPTETQSPPKPKRAKATSANKDISAGSKTTIDNLKSYVNKCGLRKVWSKELIGMNAAQQIRHLKKLLEELGMEGRPTVEKCKKIKAKRELQAELAAMNEDDIINDLNDASEQEDLSSRKRRSVARKEISYNVDQVSDSEESEADNGDAGDEEAVGSDDDNNDNEVEETESESDAYTEDNNNNSDSDIDETNGKINSDRDEES
ncbi:hypothetical protein EV175_006387 [Coemansia sp. RSA 1933]|nr:hypothetical protein EV175_006387 [Coemansia sp. RSA 1933]